MGFIDSKTARLKDGTEVVIRVGEERDADQLIQNGKHYVEHGEGQVLVPGELDPTHEQEIVWVKNHFEKPTNLLLVAEINGKLAGHLDFYGGTRKRLQHTGHFGMGIREEHRSRGIGRLLLSRLIEWANNTSLEKINLQVLSNNVRAITLYKSVGFVEAGRKRKEVKLGHNNYLDDVSMELLLRE